MFPGMTNRAPANRPYTFCSGSIIVVAPVARILLAKNNPPTIMDKLKNITLPNRKFEKFHI